MSDCSTVVEHFQISNEVQAGHQAGPAGRRRHVLVVDDDPTNRRVLQGMLGQIGYECTTVHDGAQAVRAVAAAEFDAILMDCLMPVMDGYDATRAIRADEQSRSAGRARARVPVIAVTALAMHGARDRCLAAGMDDYLTKPVMLESLEAVLHRWIVAEQASAAWSVATPATPAALNGPIDEQVLDELRALGDDTGPALIAELMHDFGTEIPARFQSMREAIVASDVPTLLHALHFVAGCAAIVGAREVERLARSVDAKREPATAEAAAQLVDQLETAYRDAQAYLTAVVEAAGA